MRVDFALSETLDQQLYIEYANDFSEFLAEFHARPDCFRIIV